MEGDLGKMEQHQPVKFQPLYEGVVNCLEGLEAEFAADKGNFDGRIFDEIFDHEESLKYYRGDVPQEASHYDPFPEKIRLG